MKSAARHNNSAQPNLLRPNTTQPVPASALVLGAKACN